ncbi:msf membrane transporter [Niveomyces insectorum RCEF 264]|uniref:Msf membrane transporter n=1 Tax=Niveomyces insectorum RCEF 264 TaxID=1081102 RepID=A0A167P5G9_9HYPO|nr:msf membrane transporter [Niveomyces insectorum RCEF 264]
MDRDSEKDDSGASTLGGGAGLGNPADADLEKAQPWPHSHAVSPHAHRTQRNGTTCRQLPTSAEIPAAAPGATSSPPTTPDAGKAFSQQPPPLLASERTEADMDPAYLVRFTPDDPDDPHNFGGGKKYGITFLLGALAITGSLGSSIITPAESTIAADLGMAYEVTVLLLALFVLGYALGPMLWAPVSEAYGRRWSMLPAVTILGLFSIGSATSRTPAALLVTRFLAGVFGSAPISNVSAALGDFYGPRTRGVAMAFYSVCVLGGASIGPVLGAAIVFNPHMGWRWTQYMEAIIAFAVAAVGWVALPETYNPVLLARKAARLRAAPVADGGDPRYWHPQEFVHVTLQNVVTKHLSRPLRMFLTEPIVTCIALYASFVYGLIFMLLEVFPIVFRDNRHMGPVVSNLPILALFVGTLAAFGINIANQPVYARVPCVYVVKNNGGHAAPEARLPPIFVGGFFLSVGFFWFGWTAAPRYHWALPTVAGGFVGAGFNILFQQCLNYLVDTYGRYAASATSANTVLRSLLACALPLAARPMFNNMGVGPAATVLGAISCVALPVPFLFMRYGPWLRAKSKNTA